MALDHATVFKTPTASDTVLSEVVRRLVEAYRPERIYLFGSVARGDAGPDSDYDIMVVVPDDAPPELRRSRAAYVALWGTGVASDVLVWTALNFAPARSGKAEALSQAFPTASSSRSRTLCSENSQQTPNCHSGIHWGDLF